MEIKEEIGGVGLQIPVPASELCVRLCACVCVHLAEKDMCLCQGSGRWSEQPTLPTAGLGSFSQLE